MVCLDTEVEMEAEEGDMGNDAQIHFLTLINLQNIIINHLKVLIIRTKKPFGTQKMTQYYSILINIKLMHFVIVS